MISLHSPAKVNYFLKIVSKRADGYHNIATLIQAVDLMDRLDIELADSDSLSCNDKTIPTDHTNLVMKALDLFRKKSGKSICAKVHLEKAIPAEAGLGGGSGNAATMLWGLNQLTGSTFSEKELQEWSIEIGCDIPFFFSTGSAFCTKLGEDVQSVSLPQTNPLWIVKPSVNACTRKVFGNFKLGISHDEGEALQGHLANQPIYFNDLEKASIELFPEIGAVKGALISQGYKTTLMTGSGSALFCYGCEKPQLKGVKCYLARPIMRKLGGWYEAVLSKE